MQPGNMWGGANNAKNVLVRAIPVPTEAPVEIAVTFSNQPTAQWEQANLVWYYDGGHMVKLGQELVTGRLSIVMGREENDRARTVAIVPLDANTVELRLQAVRDRVRGQFRTAAWRDWRDVGECDLPVKGEPKASFHFYNGPPNEEHWVRVNRFTVRRLPANSVDWPRVRVDEKTLRTTDSPRLALGEVSLPGGFVLLNSLNGVAAEPKPEYEQSVYRHRDGSYGWRWDRRTTTSKEPTFAGVGFGAEPFQPGTNRGRFQPIEIAALKSMKLELDAVTRLENDQRDHNLVVLLKTKPASQIAIWFDWYGPASEVQTLNDGYRDYGHVSTQAGTGQIHYRIKGFRGAPPRLNLKAFLDDAARRGLAPPSQVLGVWFGNQIWNGSRGGTLVTKLDVIIDGKRISSVPAASDASAAAPPMPLRLPAEAPASVREVQGRIYRAAQKQAHYLLGTVRPWNEDATLRLLTDSKSGEHWIRPNAGAVEGFAFLHCFGPYDEKIAGVSRTELLSGTILPMMRYLVTTHVTGSRPTSDGKQWGEAWQSAHWAQMLGRGAWFLEAGSVHFAKCAVPADLCEGVRRVVAYEADRIARSEPPHQMRSDTKAEENAWNSQVLSVAMLLLPDDPRRAGWETAHQKWVMSSFFRPADERNDTVVDGRPVREQFTGANIFDDFTLENHDFVHPDYMTAFSLSLGCAPDFAMSGRRKPEALLFNVAPIYENLKWMLLPDGSFVYPNGQDWELFRNPSWLGKHVLMAVWARDPDAWTWTRRTLDTLEKMQARSTNGAVFYPGEYFFASTQHDLLRSLANAWLSLQLAADLPNAPSERAGVRRWDSAKVMLCRTPDAIHTVSWGAKIMAQCVPRRLDRVVSPHERNGVGSVRLAGERAALPLRLQQADVRDGANGFEARLTVDHGHAIRAHLVFRSEPDGSFVMTEKLVALTNITTADIATGLIGVLNNPHWIYESARRRVAADAKLIEATSGGGQRWHWDAAKHIAVDDALVIESEQPLRTAYLAADRAERGRVTDRLVLNYLPGHRTWTAGETLSSYQAVVRCGKSKL